MKTRLSLLALLASLMLTSCTLFIEDDDEDLSHGLDLYKKTVYTGDGWSEPAVDKGEGYEITYQYQDNVKLLTDEIQSYIVSFQIDELYGALGIIDFREDTPEQFLPRIGEMVTSRETELMPDGIGAEVMWAGYIDGVYRICTCSVTLDKIFKELNGEYDLSVASLIDGESQPAAPSRSATTRSDEGDVFTVLSEEANLEQKEADESHYFKFDLPLKIKIPAAKLPGRDTVKTTTSSVHVVDKWGIVHSDRNEYNEKIVIRGTEGYLEVDPKESYMRHRLRVKVFFANGTIVPMLSIKDTIVTDATIHIKNGFAISKTWSKKDIFPQLKLRGIISLKLLLGASFGLSAGVYADAAINIRDSSYVQTDVDLMQFAVHMSPTTMLPTLLTEAATGGAALASTFKNTKAVNYAQKWKLEGSVEGTAKVDIGLSVGAALWTEKISVSVYAKNVTKAVCNSPSIFNAFGDDAWGVSISKKPGIKADNNLSVGLRFGLTCNLYEVIKSIQEDAVIGGKLLAEFYKELMIAFRGIATEYGLDIDITDAVVAVEIMKAMEETLKKQSTDMEKATKEKNLDLEKEFELHKWKWPLFDVPWFPDVNFKKYKQKAVSDNANGDTWEFEWAYNKLGILPWAGYMPLYPCIYIDGGKGNKANGTYFPKTPVVINEGTNIEKVRVKITVPDLQEGITYQAYPALATGPNERYPLLYDTSQSLTPKLVDVVLKNVNTETYYPTDKEHADYHGYKIVGHVQVKGAAKINHWGLFFKPYEDSETMSKDYRDSLVKDTQDQPVTFFVVTKRNVINTTMHGDYSGWVTNENGERKFEYFNMNTLPVYVEWNGFDFSDDSRRRSPQARPMSEWPEQVKQQIDEIIKTRPFYDTSPIVIAGD